MEARIYQSFIFNRPSIEQTEGNHKEEYTLPDWMDLINTDIGELNPSSNGKYRFNTGGVCCDIEKENRNTLCSTFTQKLLQTVESEDMTEEENARFGAAIDIIQILIDINQGKTCLDFNSLQSNKAQCT